MNKHGVSTSSRIQGNRFRKMEILSIIGALAFGMALCGCGKILRDKMNSGNEGVQEQETIDIVKNETNQGYTNPTDYAETLESAQIAEEGVGETDNPSRDPVIKLMIPVPGEQSIANLLSTAVWPLGNTMYVWGGGWNEEDTGAGEEALQIGVSPRWKEFAQQQDSSYDYKKTEYQIHDGLDCSGYIGWLIYNVFNTENDKEGYVMSAKDMAETFAGYGWGNLTERGNTKEWYPGDIVSMSSHVWMCLGQCEDGSVLLIHSSPAGVKISGTKLPSGGYSQAVDLAIACMQNYYPDWYRRYPDCSVDVNYLDGISMHWNQETMKDAKQFQHMTAEEIVELLFP
ncbi:MAG: hypothetical protein ACI4AQ_10350 [Lachnospiraceae bacterium]